MLRNLILLCCLFGDGLLASSASVNFAPRQDTSTGFTNLVEIAVADFNGDGKLDVAVTDFSIQSVFVYLNDGTGRLGVRVSTPVSLTGGSGPSSMVAGDVNEDGKPDLIVETSSSDHTKLVLLGKGDGTFTPAASIPGSSEFLTAVLVDVNSDGHLDLVSAGYPNLSVHLGDGKGGFGGEVFPNAYQNTTFFPQQLYSGVVVADFSLDRHPDLVASAVNPNSNAALLRSFTGLGDGTFRPSVDSASGQFTGINAITSADFNGDGRPDLLLGLQYAAQIVFGNGDGTLQTNPARANFLPTSRTGQQITSMTAYDAVASADINGDGIPDAVVTDDSTHLLNVLLNDGTGHFPQSQPGFTAAILPGTNVVKLADMNGDGLADVIVSSPLSGTVSVFLSIYNKVTPTVTVTSSAASVLVGSPIAVSMKVAGTGATIATGSVVLSEGSTLLGQATLDAGGQATLTLASLAAGQHTFTAAYAGDIHFTAAASSGSAIAVSVMDFAVALPTATQTVGIGKRATYPVNVTPVAGFTGTVTLSCSGLPVGYSCAPVTTTLNAQAATTALVVTPSTTTAREGSPLHAKTGGGILAAIGCMFMLGFGRRDHWRRSTLMKAALALVAFAGITGCGGSSKPAGYTGTSAFTITATATQGGQSVSHPVTATLIVQ